jgi:hypothetical protein
MYAPVNVCQIPHLTQARRNDEIRIWGIRQPSSSYVRACCND